MERIKVYVENALLNKYWKEKSKRRRESFINKYIKATANINLVKLEF